MRALRCILSDEDQEDCRQKQWSRKIGGYTVPTSSLNFASPKQLFVKRLMDIAGGLGRAA